jgi:GAF domain-containing protein
MYTCVADPRGDTVGAPFAVRRFSPQEEKDGRYQIPRRRTRTGVLAGYALTSPGPVVVEDLRKENRFEDIDLLQEHGVVSGLSTTIHVGGRAYGVLSAYTKEGRLFTEDEILFLQEVAVLP